MVEDLKNKHDEYIKNIGYIIAIFSVLDQELTHIVSKYFCKDDDTSFFLAQYCISTLNFNNKLKLFNKICERENINEKTIKKVTNHIKKVQEIRNKVAHFQLSNVFEEGKHTDIHFKRNASFVESSEILELSPELTRDIIYEQNHALGELIGIKIKLDFNK